MRDIGFALNQIMQTEKCSPMCALFMLREKDEDNEFRILQSESNEKTRRRLRDSSNIKVSK